MKHLSSLEVRKLWIDFFVNNDHYYIESKSIVPENDPSLLLINSGVATLKDYFSNKKIPPYKNLTNIQKCIRTNDIDNIGKTARHLSFFEMLGNFSIGGYFKEKAIELGYKFIFEVLELEKDKIYITYHKSDQITYDKWVSLSIDPSHLIEGTDDTNFWDVGQGPCGYSTEIFVDRGIEFDPKGIGLDLLKKDIENDRYLEIWNIVFSEFNNDGKNNYQELAQKNIDTGAGFERIVALSQKGITNFDSDLFLPIIKEIEKLSNQKYVSAFDVDKKQIEINANFRIIADHIRTISIMIQDGIRPSNAGRSYVLRKLIRRSYRFGDKLGIEKQHFLYLLIDAVQKTLPFYIKDQDLIKKTILHEETLFSKTIKQGEKILLEEIKNHQKLSSEIVFKMYETYGYPIDLTCEIAKEKNVEVDLSKIKELEESHSNVSKSTNVAGMESQINVIQKVDQKISEFIGYQTIESQSKLIFQEKENDQYYLLFDKTPFYATSGGQQFDRGLIDDQEVKEVFKDKFNNHWHILDNKIENNPLINLSVNKDWRDNAMRNHSATHLLGKAIFDILGDVKQTGSENSAHKLRLDFYSQQKPTEEQLKLIENKVNEYIQKDLKRKYIITSFAEAKKMGAWILDKEQVQDFDKEVRVVNFGDVSIELCGGTHVENTKFIEKFKIISLDSKGSSNYRIQAITSFAKINEYEKEQIEKEKTVLVNLINRVKKENSNYVLDFEDNLEDIIKKIDQAKKDLKTFIKKNQENVDLPNKIDFIKWNDADTYINLDIPSNKLKSWAVNLREQFPDKLFILASVQNNQSLLAISSKKYNCEEILDKILINYPGKGGGSKILVMAKVQLITEL